MNIWIIGTGNIANGWHAPAIVSSNNLKLVAVLSRNLNRGQEFIKKFNFNDASIYTDIEKFTNDKSIELVIICSPDGLHFEYAKKCLEAGKHILLEKPMSFNINDCNQLIKLAQEKNLILATGFHLRHHTGHNELLKKITNENAIGDIRHIRAIWAWPQENDSNWRAKDELSKWWSLSAVGAHCFDMVRWISNNFNDWESLKSIINNNIWNGPNDESAVIAGKLSSGITVEIVSSIQFGPYNRLEIFGSNGHAICHWTFGREWKGEISINGNNISFKPINPFYAQIQNVFHSIKNWETLIADWNVGLINVKDLSLAKDSSKQLK